MKKMKKVLALMLAVVMACGMLTACGGTEAGNSGSGEGGNSSKGEEITLEVYSQLANYSGEMKGWFAKILKDKWNVKINLIPESGGVYDTRMESGDLGDIVVWGADGEDYVNAVNAGLLFDWEEDDLVQDYGPYIYENMKDALEKNREVSGTGKVYGFGHSVARSSESHDAFFYTWDLRWDLYSQLGYPEVRNMDDMMEVLEDMKEICPTDDNGKETYAMSLWPDWDGNYVMYVKSMATAYYGYDEMGFGHYNVTNGEYYDALAEGSPYLEMLAWFNELYRRDLLDPDSMTQIYTDMIEKVQNGGVFFSIFNYAGSLAYNKEEHYAENKIMESLVPSEANPIVYGLSTLGGNRVWSIGANTQYPEVCMEIINWLSTPEGRLTIDYGPKGLCWDYDENGKTYLTDFGKTCAEDRTTLMPDEWGGATFNDGSFQVNNITWAAADTNPESGEPYDRTYWASEQVEGGRCATEADWREKTGCVTVNEYMENTNYVVDVQTSFSEGSKSDALKTKWEQVATCLKEYSWRAIYAKDEAEFKKIVAEMRGKAMSYGYNECIQWCKEEAARKNALQEPLRQK
ncbi:MAG: hypothetical protein IJ282_04320 [Lachnospiraceae bacterium]|nr:hypothetical protein [Lachnospiraceae bacterium]